MKSAWKPTKLSEILNPVSRSESVHAAKEYRLLGIRLDGRGPFQRETKLGSQISATTLSKVEAGDFIYSRLFAWRGAFGVINSDLDGGHVSGEFPTFKPIANKLDIEFLRLWFRLPSTLSKVEAKCTGSTPLTRNRFKENFFLQLEIPLPSLSEQQRIVARMEELAAKIEEARRLRRESVEEVRTLIGAFTDDVYALSSSRYGQSKLIDVCTSITDGDHLTPKFSDAGVKFIFVGNVSSGQLHFNNCKYVTPEYFSALKPQRKPQKGDILYSAVGATLGIPALVDTTENFCFQRHVAIIKPDSNKIKPKFAWHMLRSNTAYRKAWSQTTGSAQPTIPLKAIRELTVPTPSLEEQQLIIDYLNDLEAKTDSLKQLQSHTGAELDALTPAILDRAFRGEL